MQRYPFEYSSNFKIMKVAQNSAVRWKTKHWVYLTIALKEKYVGVEFGEYTIIIYF